MAWAVAVDDVEAVAARLGLQRSAVGRGGAVGALAGLPEALAEPTLPFFIERHGDARGAGIDAIEVSGDAVRLGEMARGCVTARVRRRRGSRRARRDGRRSHADLTRTASSSCSTVVICSSTAASSVPSGKKSVNWYSAPSPLGSTRVNAPRVGSAAETTSTVPCSAEARTRTGNSPASFVTIHRSPSGRTAVANTGAQTGRLRASAT